MVCLRATKKLEGRRRGVREGGFRSMTRSKWERTGGDTWEWKVRTEVLPTRSLQSPVLMKVGILGGPAAPIRPQEISSNSRCPWNVWTKSQVSLYLNSQPSSQIYATHPLTIKWSWKSFQFWERMPQSEKDRKRERVQIPKSGIQSSGLCICSEDQGGMYISAQMIGPINNLKSHVITQLGRNESWNSSVYQRYHFHIFQIPSIIIISINAIKVI